MRVRVGVGVRDRRAGHGEGRQRALVARGVVVRNPVRVRAAVRPAVREAPPERRRAAPSRPEPDRHHQRGGDQVDPGEEVLREDVAGREERHQAERDHPDGVGDGHEQAQQQGVAGGAARPHQVRRHHRLAVAGRQGVQGAPARGQQQGDGDHAEREVVVDEAREPAGRRLGHAALGVGGQRADGARALAGAPGEGGLGHVEGALQQAARVRAQLVRDVLVGRGRVGDAGAARGAHDQLVPAEAVAVGRHADLHRAAPAVAGGPGRAVPGRVPEHLEAALAGPEARRLGDRSHGDAPPADRQADLGGAPAGARGGVGREAAVGLDERALAEARDLGHVDDLAQVELAAAGLDAQVAVDGEVAERVGRGRPGAGDEHGGERRQGGEDEEAAPHDPSLRSSRRATGAQRTEKAGLRLSDADRRRRAAGASPAHAAAIPAWKSISASRVPRRRLRVA